MEPRRESSLDLAAHSQLTLDLTGGAGGSPVRQAERLSLQDAEVLFYRQFFSKEDSDKYLKDLLANAAWTQERMRWYGKVVDLPRLTAWYGDDGAIYMYSGIRVEPRPWTATLLAIKERVEKVSGVVFNSVLLNLYRHGRDSVSWHSDDEPELGNHPIIGSVSLGETRMFHFRHKLYPTLRAKVDLSHGSYLLMRGSTQENWLHEIPKSSRPLQPRINLTFRVIKEILPRNVSRHHTSRSV